MTQEEQRGRGIRERKKQRAGCERRGNNRLYDEKVKHN